MRVIVERCFALQKVRFDRLAELIYLTALYVVRAAIIVRKVRRPISIAQTFFVIPLHALLTPVSDSLKRTHNCPRWLITTTHDASPGIITSVR